MTLLSGVFANQARPAFAVANPPSAPPPAHAQPNSPSSNYYTYTSFSGADIVATITVPILLGSPVANINPELANVALTPITIGNIQTLTVSTHRDKFPVRALKSINPRGFTRGPRTIAGTIIFAMFDRESLREIQDRVQQFLSVVGNSYNTAVNNVNTLIPPRFLTDELPPFDITITAANEYGSVAKIMITGVEVLDWGNVMGVDDIYMEETVAYSARDIIPLHPDSIMVNPAPKVQ